MAEQTAREEWFFVSAELPETYDADGYAALEWLVKGGVPMDKQDDHKEPEQNP